jgi:hypothetical protein
MKPDIVAPGVNIMSANSDANMSAQLRVTTRAVAASVMRFSAGTLFNAATHSRAKTKAGC